MGSRGSTRALSTVRPEVQVEALSYGYGPNLVLDRVSLTLARGELVALVGPSGAGKTTLLKLIVGLLRPTHGRIRLGGAAGRLRIGYVPQVTTVDWQFPVTVEQVAMMGRWREMGPWPWPRRGDRRMVADLLERLRIGELRSRQIAALSGGQQQRVFLARALAAAPELLVLDEPTASLDEATQREIWQVLLDLNRTGVTILLSTHQLQGLGERVGRAICLNQRLIADGPPGGAGWEGAM